MIRFLIPAGFIALIALLAMGLTLNPREVPSPLIDKPAPAFSLPRLHAPDKLLSGNDMRGQVWLLNVWASWCVACRQEHPFMVELAAKDVAPIIGLNYKDLRDDAKRWLQQFGDPYAASAFDADGRVGIDWGVYGVPETFVIDKRGAIRFKQIGPVTRQVLDETLLPLLYQLQNESS